MPAAESKARIRLDFASRLDGASTQQKITEDHAGGDKTGPEGVAERGRSKTRRKVLKMQKTAKSEDFAGQ